MSRLLVHVEGETEETFVNELLRPHLVSLGWSIVSARLLGNARRRDRRGGIKSWASVRNEIVRHLLEDAGRVVTTMVDYYGLPRTGSSAWPGREEASSLPFPDKARTVEDEFSASIQEAMGDGFNARISEAGWIDSNGCRTPAPDAAGRRLARRPKTGHLIPPSASGSRRRRRTISTRASGTLARNSRWERSPRQAGRRGGSGSSASISSRSKS